LSKYKKYQVSIIDKDSPIVGASTGNAGTITLSSYSPWTTVNMWEIVKQNLLMKRERDAYLRFSLVFDKDFRYWMTRYLSYRNKEAIERGSRAILSLGQYSIRLFDSVVSEITSNPDEVEYHSEPFINTQKKITEEDIKGQVIKFDRVKKFDGEFLHLNADQDEPKSASKYSTYFEKNHPSGMFKEISVAYLFSCSVINPLKFCLRLQEYLKKKYDVNFIHGEMKNFYYTSDAIKSVEYLNQSGELITDDSFDTYVISGGIGSLFLGKLLGIKVPIFGFKGHSLDIYLKNQTNFNVI